MGRRIIDAQLMLVELGRIRVGLYDGRPRASETFILTSLHRDYIAAAAQMWGGTPEEWQPQGSGGKVWRVVTESKAIDAILPPGDPISQSYELWSRGGIARRCDGGVEERSGQPCLCKAKWGEGWQRRRDIPQGQACETRTRFNVFLPLTGFGCWRLETNSWYGGMETLGMVTTVKRIMGDDVGVSIVLAIEPRTRVSDGKTAHFQVVTVGFPEATTRILARIVNVQSLTGSAGLAPADERPALSASPAPPRQATPVEALNAPAPGVAVPALGSGRATPTTEAGWREWVDQATTLDELRGVWRMMSAAGAIPGPLREAFHARKATLDKGEAEDPQGGQSTPVAVGQAADAEPDADVVWGQILKVAGERGWTLPQVEARMRETIGKDPSEADGPAMALFLEALTTGVIQ